MTRREVTQATCCRAETDRTFSPEPKCNADGSVDLFVGAEAPAGFERNFMKTVGDDGWFVCFRLHAPLQPCFDKTFGLADFEKLD